MKREEMTAIYNEANGITTKHPPISTERIFRAMQEVERRTIEKCAAVIQSYQIPCGNSAAGEIAAEMTLSMLREVRDEIRALANQQEKQT